MRVWSWIFLAVWILSLPLDFQQISRMQRHLRAGDGAGTIRACKALACFGAVTTTGMFGSAFLNRRLAYPAASAWQCLLNACVRVGLFPIVIAVCCLVFYKRGNALLNRETGTKKLPET